jgi:hypothetical protein
MELKWVMELTTMNKPGYNPCDAEITLETLTPQRSADNLSPFQTTGTQAPTEGSNAPTVSGQRIAKTQERDAARERRRDVLQFRRSFGHFVAQETGTRYQPSIVGYEPKCREKRVEKRQPMDTATVRDSERFLDALVAMETINPDQESPVVVEGEYVSAYKAAMLQSLARGVVRVRGLGGS